MMNNMLTRIKRVLRESGTDVDEQSTILTESVLIKIIEEVFSLLEAEMVVADNENMVESAKLILPSGDVEVFLADNGTSIMVDQCEVQENFCGSAVIHINGREIHCNACNTDGATIADLIIESNGVQEYRKLKVVKMIDTK